REKIENAAHALPAQGPITVVVHHNTLDAMEDQPFDLAVAQGAHTFGCHPYLSEAQYHQHLGSGRIQLHDLGAVLRADLGEAGSTSVGGLCTRFDLRMAMLRHHLEGGSEVELRWLVADSDALTRFRSDVSE